MATETSLSITPGTGGPVHGYQMSNNTFRQSVVIGDATDKDKTAPVDATYGLSTDVKRIAAGASADIGAVADAAVTNPASSGSVIAFLKGLVTHLATFLTNYGTSGDAAVTAGATGSEHAKLRRISADLDTARSGIGGIADAEALTGNGNLVQLLKRLRSMTDLPNTGAFTNVTVDTSADTLLASTHTRRAYKLWNKGSVDVYIGEGFTPTTANYTYILAASGGFYESGARPFTGAIVAITASGSAVVNITEQTYV